MKLSSQVFKYIAFALLALASSWASAAGKTHGIELKVLDALLKSSSDQVIFIDVRDPGEIMFTGFTDAVDLNIPYQTVDRKAWNEKKGCS